MFQSQSTDQLTLHICFLLYKAAGLVKLLFNISNIRLGERSNYFRLKEGTNGIIWCPTSESTMEIVLKR